ncbi:Ku protein [Geobacter sp. DSM 9736]|uniref:non-homologous end joining protein Ku n=1 Tax=Geobacter sp. DSM 9736 TaxID=1277350 RepID=UPI000B5007B3|nr:Ku protein [Geobacter sp. DSM 9736]SNB45168.1 DNA end-binding protein Ku [Geobacter sp. DSM 9736]
MRAIWSGSINFGLVNIPVKLFSGSESNTLDLDMLRKSDLCPVRYMKVCKYDGQEIPNAEIVKGYEYSDGRYVVLTDQDFESANVEKTHTIDILDFVEEQEIDSRFFEKPYYLEPVKTGMKPYALLREALRQSKKVGIASYVLRNRGNIGVIKTVGEAIVLNQMRYQEEVRGYEVLNLPSSDNVRKQEVDLALMLIDQYTSKFDPSKYKDTYVEDLKKVIEAKAQGMETKPAGKEPRPAKVVDMMTLLKESLKKQKPRAA